MIGLNLLPQIIVDSLSVNEFKMLLGTHYRNCLYMILHKYSISDRFIILFKVFL